MKAEESHKVRPGLKDCCFKCGIQVNHPEDFLYMENGDEQIDILCMSCYQVWALNQLLD